MTYVDHLLVSVADPQPARERWSAAGLTATVGGEHPGGTSNALVRGPRPAYLELISAAPHATSEAGKRVLATRGPLSWAVGVNDMERTRAAIRDVGFDVGPIRNGSRQTPEGDVLRWRTCDLAPIALHPFIPFLIEWQTTMSCGPAIGPVLTGVTIECPDPQWLRGLLQHTGLPGLEGHGYTFNDGEVTLTLVPGHGGVRVAEVTLPGQRLPDVTLDGLRVRRAGR